MFGNFASVITKPQLLNTVFFETQRNDETIKLLIRRHPITNLTWISNLTILAAIPILLFMLEEPITTVLSWPKWTDLLPNGEGLALVFMYYLTVLYYTFLKFLEWFFNVLIVTDRRVIDITYRAPFSRETTQAQLEEIQDIRHTQEGIFASLFDYGNIYIQTAGIQQTILLRRVPKPGVVHDSIISLLP